MQQSNFIEYKRELHFNTNWTNEVWEKWPWRDYLRAHERNKEKNTSNVEYIQSLWIVSKSSQWKMMPSWSYQSILIYLDPLHINHTNQIIVQHKRNLVRRKKKCEIRGKKIDSMKNGWNSVGMSLESVEIARKVVYIARENQVKIKCENKSEDQSNVWGVTLRKVSFEMNPCRFTWVSFQLNTNNHFDLFAFFSRRVFACFVVMCSGDIVYVQFAVDFFHQTWHSLHIYSCWYRTEFRETSV